jgi:hypothetical protein
MPISNPAVEPIAAAVKRCQTYPTGRTGPAGLGLGDGDGLALGDDDGLGLVERDDGFVPGLDAWLEFGLLVPAEFERAGTPAAGEPDW